MFNHDTVNLDILKRRAFNYRWATVKDGVIPLTAADPDFPCAPEITEAINKFIKDRYLCYGPPEGLAECKESISTFFEKKRNVLVTPSCVLPVDSAAFGIYLICQSFLNKGDEAVIFDPVDFLFQYSVEAVGAIPVAFSIPPGNTEIDFELLESLISAKTKMLCICNPVNPTGKVLTEKELLHFGKIAEKYNLLILSDEIWSDIVYSPSKYLSIASLNDQLKNRTIIVTGFSKSYGLAGLRIGAIIASNSKLFKKLFETSLHSSTIHGANIIGQVAATAALNNSQEWLHEFLKHLQLMRDLCIERIKRIKNFSCFTPEGTYVAFVNISASGMSSAAMTEFLLEKASVAVVPGLPQWFGKGAIGYIRICFATSDTLMNEAFNRIETFIN